jgi:hypothetical protein
MRWRTDARNTVSTKERGREYTYVNRDTQQIMIMYGKMQRLQREWRTQEARWTSGAVFADDGK